MDDLEKAQIVHSQIVRRVEKSTDWRYNASLLEDTEPFSISEGEISFFWVWELGLEYKFTGFKLHENALDETVNWEALAAERIIYKLAL